MVVFKPAQRKNILARVALCGPTGSGKTFTALGIASTLADGGKVAVIDTERSSADRYADRFQFDACPLDHYSPEAYMEAIEAARAGGYAVLVIDSLSHAWDGAEGLLERVDAITKRSKSQNSFNAWLEATPLHRRLIDSILAFPGHVIVTMRSKMEYIIETNERGKQVPRKVGMAPIQRQGVEYEFDIVGEMDQEHNLIITKSRAFELADKVINRPGRKFALEILAWARGGRLAEPAVEKQQETPVAPSTISAPAPAPQVGAAPPLPANDAKPTGPTQGPSTPHASEAAPPLEPAKNAAPLANDNPDAIQSAKVVAAQLKEIRDLAIKNGMKSVDEIRELVSAIVQRDVKASTDLSAEERLVAIAGLKAMLAQSADTGKAVAA